MSFGTDLLLALFSPRVLWPAALLGLLSFLSLPQVLGQTTSTAGAVQQPAGMVPCAELPEGQLSDEELARLVPEGSPGRVRIRWRTESQEECYGFHIYRADQPGGTFSRVNKSVIPGEGSTNIPRDYCYEDQSVERGKTYYYYIEEISTAGVATKLEDTLGPDGKGTKVKVKTVPEEREWLRRKALGDQASPSSQTTAPASVSPEAEKQ